MPNSAHLVDATTYLSYTMDGATDAGETGYGTPGRSATKDGTGTVSSVAGLIGNARRFTYGDGAVLRAPVATYEPDGWGKAFTVEWRMKLRALDSGGDGPEIFFIGGTSTLGATYKARVFINPALSRLDVESTLADSSSVSFSTSYIIPIGEWKHYALVSYSDGTNQQYKLYVNGVEVFDSTSLVLGLDGGPAFTTLTWTYGPWVHIGANAASDFNPSADFDDFAIRTDTRSAAQVLADAQRAFLTLTAPASGATVYREEETMLAWVTENTVSNVKLEYSANGGATWETISASTANVDSYAWTAPIATTSAAKVRVSEASTGSPTSTSSAFTVGARFPTAHMRQLRQLLPPGKLWSGLVGSKLNRLLAAIGDELARVERRALAFLEEVDPRTAVETLPQWEAMLGLPDDLVLEIPGTTAGRRLAITQQLLKTGGQSAAYFIGIAAACGYTVTVTQGYAATVFRAGVGRAGDLVRGVEWAHVWKMTVQPPAGVALTHAELERIIVDISPAHTVVFFEYV